MPERNGPSDSAVRRVDIAVVGAGVSGAYAAWRLKERYPEKSIALFERSNRVGGRLYTTTLPGMPNVNVELGGMRFIPEQQRFVTALVDHLKLPTKPFPMGGPAPDGARENIMYLRGKLLRVRELDDWTKVPYTLRDIERGRTPDGLQQYVVESLFPSYKSFTRKDWYGATVLNGQFLHDWGFWNLLYEVLSSEAYHFMQDAGGYYTTVANSNAASSLPVTEFAPETVYMTLAQGYDHLPKRLNDLFVRGGGEFIPDCRLEGFARPPDQPYELTFARTATSHGQTTDLKPRLTCKFRADQVILAMPRRSLELVDWPPLKDQGPRDDLQSVIMQPALKLFLAYEYPWWRSLGLKAGRSITDMPIRQTYYFGTEGDEGGEPKNLNSLMMASYNDVGAVPFWKGLERGSDFEGNAKNRFLIPGERPVPAHVFRVTRDMILQAQIQLKVIHGLKFVPEPYSAICHDWTEDPYGGGWHAWKAGFEFWKVIKRMRKPLDKENVFICGEAYSNVHGWVEGALQTAELMLQENHDLPWPDWLPRTDLGP